MVEKPHIVRVVADEARRVVYRSKGVRADAPQPRIMGDEIGVLFEDGEFIPYADLGYSHDTGFFRLSDANGTANDAMPFAAAGRLIDCGQVVVTTGVSQRLTNDEITDLLDRHASGDFGDYGEFYELDVTDEMLRNGRAGAPHAGLVNKVHILTGMNAVTSAYTVRGLRIWVITEAGENRTTAFLFAGPVEC